VSHQITTQTAHGPARAPDLDKGKSDDRIDDVAHNRVVFLVGMLAGIVMGIEQDFQLAPAYANPN
jgi:hypothetical protein